MFKLRVEEVLNFRYMCMYGRMYYAPVGFYVGCKSGISRRESFIAE